MSAVRRLILDVERHGARLVAAAPDKVKVVGKPLPSDLIKELRSHKAELFTVLQHEEFQEALRAAQDALDRFEERAAILEYDAGLPRDEAERLARRECLELDQQHRRDQD